MRHTNHRACRLVFRVLSSKAATYTESETKKERKNLRAETHATSNMTPAEEKVAERKMTGSHSLSLSSIERERQQVERRRIRTKRTCPKYLNAADKCSLCAKSLSTSKVKLTRIVSERGDGRVR